MILALLVLAVLLSLATALASVLARRDSLQETASLRRQVASLTQRLEEAERAAQRAAGHAEAAAQLLLEKGVAGEGELEGRGDPGAQVEAQPRGSRTVH